MLLWQASQSTAEFSLCFQCRFRLILINHLPKSTGDRLVHLIKCKIVILPSEDEITLRRDSWPFELVQIDLVVESLELIKAPLKLERHLSAKAFAASPAIVVAPLHEADAKMLLSRRI